MRGIFDFSSWTSTFNTVLSLLLMALMMMGVRLLFMQTIQKRRERENRQINERLRTLIAAYKTLGSAFTGNLTVSAMHLRDARHRQTVDDAADISADIAPEALPAAVAVDGDDDTPAVGGSSERQRRTRDAVEAALSDILLLGTEAHIRMAAQAAQDLVAGRPIQTAALVESLRSYIRSVLDLEHIPPDVHIPMQGPLRPSAGGGAGGRRNAADGPGPGGRGAGGGTGGGGGGGMGMGVGMGMGRRADEA